MLLLRQVRQQCVGALRASSSTAEKAARNEPKPATRSQVEAACVPEVFKSPDSLARHLAQSVILNEPGRYVALQQPYGVLNYSYNTERYENDSIERPVAISDCIWQLSNLLRQPGLRFRAGLKPYLTGPLILPCSREDMGFMTKSEQVSGTMFQAGWEENVFYKYSALALVVGRPKKTVGTVAGFVTAKVDGDEREFEFTTRHPIDMRSVMKSAFTWNTIASGHDCSLVHLRCQRLARHLPRLALTRLGCPILGDPKYMPRFFEVDGKAINMDPAQSSMNEGKKYIPHQLIARLGPDAPPIDDLPMYFHILQRVYPKYGDESDLTISAPLSPHFEAMIDLLGFGEAFKKFRNENTPISPSLILQGLDHESSEDSDDFRYY